MRHPISGGAATPLFRFPTGSFYDPSWAPDGMTVWLGQGYSTQDTAGARPSS